MPEANPTMEDKSEARPTEVGGNRAGPATGLVIQFLKSIRWNHAIGEIALIVIGVLIALAVNNWNVTRQERRLELTVLGQLRTALVGDLATLRDAVADIRVRETRIEELLADLDRGGPTGNSTDALFGAVLRIWELQLNRSAYETLKVRGLDLISDDSLRLRIATLYENVYVLLDQSQANDRSVVFDLVRPYYLKNFRGIQFGDSATPLSYAAVVRDEFFRNVVEYRLASLRANPISSIDAAINEVSRLIAALEAAIARQQ